MEKFNWTKLTTKYPAYVARCNYTSSAYVIKRVRAFIPVSLKIKTYNIVLVFFKDSECVRLANKSTLRDCYFKPTYYYT